MYKEILLGQPYDAKKSDVWAVGVILFIFLNGNMPFKEDKNNQLILNQVNFIFNYPIFLKEPYIYIYFKKHKLLKLYWCKYVKISNRAKSLIKSIFTYEWKDRPSVYQLLNDEWMNG